MNPCSTAKPLLQQDSNIKLYYIDCRPRKDSQLCTHPGAQGRKFENMKQLTKNMNCIMQNYHANQESLPKVNTAQGLSPTPSITGIFRSKRLLVTSNCLHPTKVKQMRGYLQKYQHSFEKLSRSAVSFKDQRRTVHLMVGYKN